MIMIIRFGSLIGEIIATARAFANMTQAQLSAGSGVAGSQISKYETMRVVPDVHTSRSLLVAAGFELCALPRLEAETHDVRERVVEVAKRFIIDLDVPCGEGDLMAAVDALHEAEQHVRDGGTLPPAEKPGDRLARLERELDAAQTQLAEYEAIFGELGNAVRKATAQVLAGGSYAS